MQIPESIEKLTTSVPSTSLLTSQQPHEINFNEVILSLKKNLSIKEQEYFEQGLAFFNADVSSDKQIIKNFIKLILEAYTTSINSSEVNQEYLENAKTSFKQTLEATIQTIDSMFNILTAINKQNNFLDSKQVSLIILGYAIGTIKRLYRS